MSQENVKLVERAIAAVNDRDIDRYLACCTEDVELHTPMAAITGVHEGAGGIRRFFADVEDVGPDFRLHVESLQAIGGNRVLAFLRITATGRASGIPQVFDTPTANVYDIAGGKIRRLRIFLDRDEALRVSGDPE